MDKRSPPDGGEMVQRVKQALLKSNETEGLMFSDLMAEFAKAAIEAMRKPTPEMLSKGLFSKLPNGEGTFKAGNIHSFDDVEAMWDAMISEALE